MNILLVIITSLLVDTASTEAYLQGQYGQSTMPVAGVQDGGFSVNAHSVYDINAVSRVFGEASYSWNQTKGNRWVENADYELLYPYLTCDTIGGGMRSEQYAFRGGYRMAKDRIVWHLALQYRALQSYRSIDPRPKNKVAELDVEGSVGYMDNSYAYSLMAQVGRYKQNNDISFYSELGNAMVYHLIGLDRDYTRFAGDFLSSYYHGMNAGATLMLQPRSQGWLAAMGYRYSFITKELKSSTSTPVARLHTHTVSALIGYAGARWRAFLQADYMLRLGTQYVYGDVTGNYYHLLLTVANYHEQQLRLKAQGNYRLSLPVGYMNFVADLGCFCKMPQLAKSEETTRFSLLASFLSASQLQAGLEVRYAFPLRGRYAWFFAPVASYTHFLSDSLSASSVFCWQFSFKTGVLF